MAPEANERRPLNYVGNDLASEARHNIQARWIWQAMFLLALGAAVLFMLMFVLMVWRGLAN